jgi:hypothetical protein
VLAGFSLALGALAVWMTRFGADFAPSAALCLALLCGGAGRAAAGLWRPPAPAGRATRRACAAAGPALAVALALAALAIPLRRLDLPRARASLAALRGEAPLRDRALATAGGSLVRFLEAVRRATPETSGYLSPGVPEYGIAVPSAIGHPLHWTARRASAADGLLGLAGPANYAASQRLFATPSEAEALDLARRLRARYAITLFLPGLPPGAFATGLHRHDGLGGAEPTSHFRLVTEGPAGGRPLGDLLGLPRPHDVVPYKLFEIVPGARLRVAGAPGGKASASLALHTPLGRRLAYRVGASVGADGSAELVVAYPTDASAPVRAGGPYAVRVDGRETHVEVPEQAVREGATLPVRAEGGS